ncbi:hypothetical protein TVAG_410120 [Trichomonas vaginalis G3]|uniref:Uncharacterized protein n=1 Tax=Trichomonas vaginalis (strain ATCC PRA-98 / G3) TaxID=412133 RepID=A2E8H8_TRIV3|nr:hypothetical protein TVAGG3_0358950 [Trichomonas vaginalis G3]EAY11015.1 hypothetical protein TVAG_410120 [Trichomonas vaginalis G3]KAI5531811.1 hypothetical protein TVAGG3_0358950 [Trichomonas vaginalis G3]|eukprot:XP_001323238.1 hypothetical protein [Trichomonas vaginalis G3]
MNLPNGQTDHRDKISRSITDHKAQIEKTDASRFAKRYSLPELKVIFVRIMKLEGLTLHSYQYRSILSMTLIMHRYWERFKKYLDRNERLTCIQKVMRDGKEQDAIVTFDPIHQDQDGEGLSFFKNNVGGLFPDHSREQKHSRADDLKDLDKALVRLSEPSPEEPSQPSPFWEEDPSDSFFEEFIPF